MSRSAGTFATRVATALGMAGTLLVLAASPASAITGRAFAFKFGEDGSGAGEFKGIAGIAANGTTGNLYVLDREGNDVQEFGSKGEFIQMWGEDVNRSTGGTLCTEAEFNECQAGARSEGAGPFFEAAQSIAVDNSSGPDRGDVYVTTGGFEAHDEVVDVFSESGVYLTQITGRKAQDVAIGPTGEVYVKEEAGTISELLPSGAGGYEPAPGEGITQSLMGGSSLAVNAAGDVFVVSSSGNRWYEYGPAPEHALLAEKRRLENSSNKPYGEWKAAAAEAEPGHEDWFLDGKLERSGLNNFEQAVSERTPDGIFLFGQSELKEDEPTALAYSGYNKDVYVANHETSEVLAYEEAGTLPGVHTGGAKDVERTSAVVEATIEPDEVGAEYEVGYGKVEATEGEPKESGIEVEGDTSQTVETELTGLLPETTYYYRAQAYTESGTHRREDSYGEYLTFTTAVAVANVETGAATPVQAEAATLAGSLEPEGEEAKYYFEYTDEEPLGGPATQDSKTETIASGTTGTAQLKASLSDLLPSTVYRYRLVATREIEGETFTVDGAEETLTTPATSPAALASSASDVSAFAARLEATFDPKNNATSYHFEYGTSGAYGSQTPTYGPLGGTGPVEVAQAVEGLAPETTYYYRLVLESPAGNAEVTGAFTTLPGSPAAASKEGLTGEPEGPAPPLASALSLPLVQAFVPTPTFPAVKTKASKKKGKKAKKHKKGKKRKHGHKKKSKKAKKRHK